MDSQRLSGIGAMANGLAHDVNNLLTPVLTAAQRLKEDAFIDESQTALLETIEENCLRGAKLMSEIMKYGDGKSAGVRTIQISAPIESVVAIFRETFPRDIYLVHDVPADLHEIRADELQVD
jgi:nitrogen-specific signal transduction histidine kinase